MALIALIGTASALGDSGSPASDSTLGPTAGLNIDGQHDHIRDTCIPNFLFYNVPYDFWYDSSYGTITTEMRCEL